MKFLPLLLIFWFSIIPCSASVFDYGVATKGPLQLTGGVLYDSVNVAVEASVYIVSENEALTIIGNSQIAGNVSITNPDAYVTIQGGEAGIGGETGEDAMNHVLIGVQSMDFPVPVPDYFEHYVTNAIDSFTDTTVDASYENVRIVAGTNPIFSGNIQLKGIVFVEAPNIVIFTGNTEITGIIVGNGDLSDNSGTNQIYLLGNLDSYPVTDLPNTLQFEDLHNETGTFLMAPGFSVGLGGSFETINGVIAANGIELFGNAGGVINGTLVNYNDDLSVSINTNSDIYVHSSGNNYDPVFFEMSIPEPATLLLLGLGGLLLKKRRLH